MTEKRIAVRWLTSWASAYDSKDEGDLELMSEAQARNMAALGHVELVSSDDKAPERRVTRKRETR